MSDTDDAGGIRLEDVRRLDLQAGDILAVTVPTDSPQQMMEWADYIRPYLAKYGAEVFVLSPGTQLEIIRPDDKPLKRLVESEVQRQLKLAALRAARA